MGAILGFGAERERIVRLTSTPAVERDPHFRQMESVGFTSNRSGSNAVYTVPVEGVPYTRSPGIPAHRAPGLDT